MWTRDLCIGACGWEHDQWIGGFYPGDLPNDWRLGYYSNRLRAVLLPVQQLAQLSAADIETWPDDIDDGFRMVLEIDLASVQELATIMKKLQPVSTNIDAWLLQASDRGPASEDVVIETAINLARFYPVCINCPDPGLSADAWTRLHASGVSRCWHADEEPAPQGAGNYLIALSAQSDGKAQRKIMQSIADWAGRQQPDTGAALFFEGESAADDAVQARTIAEIMGI